MTLDNIEDYKELTKDLDLTDEEQEQLIREVYHAVEAIIYYMNDDLTLARDKDYDFLENLLQDSPKSVDLDTTTLSQNLNGRAADKAETVSPKD